MLPLPHGCMRFLPCSGAFFCSTAPQAFFRPDRRFRTPARAEAVKVGRRFAIEAHSDISRPRLDGFEHGGRLDDHGPEKSWVVEFGPFVFRSLELCERLLNELRTRSLAISRRHAFNRRCKVRS